MSVKACYAYFGLDLETGRIILGQEPLYEEPFEFASSWEALFEMIVVKDPRVDPWI